METATTDDVDEEEVETDRTNIIQLYDCVHCHQSQSSTEEKPMGLVVLLQATSVLGHKHRDVEGLVLPTNPEERSALAVEDSQKSNPPNLLFKLDTYTYDNLTSM